MRKAKGMRGNPKNVVKSCLTKTRYNTEIEANDIAARLQPKCGEQSCCPDGTWLDSYKCQFCEGYHLTKAK